MLPILLLIICLPVVHAASSVSKIPVRFESLPLEPSYHEEMEATMAQDQSGFLWFGTHSGLYKYDGYRFKLYRFDPKNPDGLSDASVTSIYSDRSGRLWIGTMGGGLNRYESTMDRFIHYRNDPKDARTISSDDVWAIAEDSAGNLWVGTWGGGVNRLESSMGEFSRFRHNIEDPHSLSNDIVNVIYKDAKGHLWIGTNDGLNKLVSSSAHGQAVQFKHFKYDPQDLHSISDNNVTAIFEDHTGTLWIGTGNGGLNRFNPLSEQFYRYRHDPVDETSIGSNKVTSIHQDRDQMLWIGTIDAGLNRFDISVGAPTAPHFLRFVSQPNNPGSLRSNIIRDIFEDRSGLLWVVTNSPGTQSDGFHKIVQGGQTFRHYGISGETGKSPKQDVVNAIVQTRSGMLWIGTQHGGLYRKVSKTFEGGERSGGQKHTARMLALRHDPDDPHSISENAVTALYEDADGILWVGTDAGGLNRYDPGTGRFKRYQHNTRNSESISSDRVTVIMEDRYAALWIGTNGGGLNKFDRRREAFVHYKNDPSNAHSLSSDAVTALFEDRAGTIWVGTRKRGLNSFVPNADQSGTPRFMRYQNDADDDNSLSSNRILTIHGDRKGILWIGTNHGGLNKWDPVSQTFAHYKERHGLPDNTIRGILEDDHGNLWLSNWRGGITKFNPRTETFTNFGEMHGLQRQQSLKSVAYKSQAGEMFVGGNYGYHAFFPHYNIHIPPVVVTDFSVFNNTITPKAEDAILHRSIFDTQAIDLTHKDLVFSFEFAALDYHAPEKNQYAYMLEGLDADWIYTKKQRTALYSNIPAGEYTFRVKGTNNDGIWNEEGVAIRIAMASAPWRTWWAYGLYLIGITAAIAAFVRLRIRSKTRELEHQQQQAYRITLEQEVAERTEALSAANAQLSQEIVERKRAEAVAEAANQAKNEFLANMSHELRTPLNSILGYTQIIKRQPQDEDHRFGIDIIHKSAEHLLGMINTILDLAKIEARKMELKPSPTDFSSFLKTTLAMARIRTEHQRIDFVSRIDAALPGRVVVDEKRLRQVLLNLLHNAIKFTQEGQVTLSVSRIPVQGRKVRFEVNDTGIGISARQLDKIFQPFEQIRNDRINPEGTGLGLSISRELVRMMGGRLQVKSRLGQGATFWFDITLTEANSAMPIEEDQKSKRGFDLQPIHHHVPALIGRDDAPLPIIGYRQTNNGLEQPPLKVLIVDDKAENRAVLKGLLAPLGFDIVEAVDGHDGLAKVLQYRPNVILMDLIMPKMDGLEAIRRIRRLPAPEKDIIVITVSANLLEQRRHACLDSGCNDFLAKPVDLDDLLEKLCLHLDLEWIYNTTWGHPEKDLSLSSPEIVPPSTRDLDGLYAAAKIGDLVSLQENIRALMDTDPRLRQFCTHVLQLTDRLQMEEIELFIKRHLRISPSRPNRI